VYEWNFCQKFLGQLQPGGYSSYYSQTQTDSSQDVGEDTMAKVCRRFHSRMEAVVGANGDYFLIEWYIMPMTFIFFYFHKI
jgi:hypothetical protein